MVSAEGAAALLGLVCKLLAMANALAPASVSRALKPYWPERPNRPVNVLARVAVMERQCIDSPGVERWAARTLIG